MKRSVYGLKVDHGSSLEYLKGFGGYLPQTVSVSWAMKWLKSGLAQTIGASISCKKECQEGLAF